MADVQVHHLEQPLLQPHLERRQHLVEGLEVDGEVLHVLVRSLERLVRQPVEALLGLGKEEVHLALHELAEHVLGELLALLQRLLHRRRCPAHGRGRVSEAAQAEFEAHGRLAEEGDVLVDLHQLCDVAVRVALLHVKRYAVVQLLHQQAHLPHQLFLGMLAELRKAVDGADVPLCLQAHQGNCTGEGEDHHVVFRQQVVLFEAVARDQLLELLVGRTDPQWLIADVTEDLNERVVGSPQRCLTALYADL
mmetsp:Transcript_7830/g.32938  ORF Transcript_7830/g.32938 Transcript_7830/m.32938 type:complete len:250 (-) Transcript_7830:696-1445(-)